MPLQSVYYSLGTEEIGLLKEYYTDNISTGRLHTLQFPFAQEKQLMHMYSFFSTKNTYALTRTNFPNAVPWGGESKYCEMR